MNHASGFVQIFVITALIAIAGVLTLVLALSGSGLRSGVSLDRILVGNAIANSVLAQRAEAFALGQGSLEPSEAIVSGERTSAVVEHDGGKISILFPPPGLVESYITRAGLDGAKRQALLADLQTLRGHEDGQGALTAIELAFGPSMPHEQIQRDFSAHTKITTIDPTFASVTVLAAIPDLTDTERADIMAARARGEAPPSGLSDHLDTPLERYYSLAVTVRWSDTEQSTRRIPFVLRDARWIDQLAAPGP